jgi:hypothetical protein
MSLITGVCIVYLAALISWAFFIANFSVEHLKYVKAGKVQLAE